MKNELFLPGTRLGSYLIKDQRPVPELNLTAITLSHEPTGARLLHLACDDPNNVFAVGFRTPPPDSTGVAHILEHTVLCGSRKYPVRDPFFTMLRRSLNTFMNALTAADWTLYPVASMNRKDYYNLMGIYLDATFFPLLREQDFRQEGHRLDFAAEGNPDSLMIKGVVFNEMKGAMADPSSLINRRLNTALFPTTCYGFNSGGEPLKIPDLSWEQLRSFHQNYYHPSNSWIFTYGNFPLNDHLHQIEKLALKHFGRQDIKSDIPRERRFEEPVNISRTFPVGPEDETKQRSMVQMAWLTCPIEDTLERAATGILSNLLLGNPAAPLYQALIESGLGRNLSPGTGYHDDYRDTFIACGLQGTDPETTAEIEALVINTLKKVADDGFPQERVDAALHQYEFASREVTGDQYPYGLGLMMRLFGPWLHADDPLSTLMVGENLQNLKNAAQDQQFFPDMIRRHLIENPHRVTLLLQPDRNHSKDEERVFAERLQQIRQSLNNDAIMEIRRKNEELQHLQETPDDTSCLPILEISDIEAHDPPTIFKEKELAGCKSYWFPQPTNGISYLNMQFSSRNLDSDLQAYLPIYCALLPQIGAAGNDYLSMSRRITAMTGGIRFATNLLEMPDNLDLVQPTIELKGKALERNQEALCQIIADILTAPDFSNIERIKTVIGQIKTSMENSIPGAGHSFAARAAAASLTPAAAQREVFGGMTQTNIIRHIADLDNQQMEELSHSFSAITRQLFCKSNLSLGMTAEESALNKIQSPLETLLQTLPGEGPIKEQSTTEFSAKGSAIGWHYNLPVAYVAQVFRTIPYTHPDAPALMVLAKLLRANFLHREIREKGGAYGGMSAYNAEGGLFSLLSYRDPHIERTIDVYEQAVDWACNSTFNEETIRESILTAFAELDRPLSPGGRGYREFLHQQQGITHDMIQKFRNGVLAVKPNAINRVALIYLKEGKNVRSTGVLAGDQMFNEASTTLDKMKMVMKSLE